MRAHLSRLLSEGRLACELEWRALASPLEVLNAKLRAFAAKKQETSGLALLTSSLVRHLPARFAHPLILRQAHRRAEELTEVQSGRLRDDFEERIKRSVDHFRTEMLDQIEATSAGIETAIDKGRGLRLQGEHAAAARQTELTAALERIASLEGRCMGMTTAGLTAVPSTA